jgi:phosphohistidine phosphatase
MKKLYLLRHAKSSWKNARLDDHERPLNKRGRRVAKTMAEHLQRAKVAPDIVLCSTAVRAKQTFDPIAKRIRPQKVVFERGIYEVSQRKLWRYLWALPENARSALVVGHNPGLHALALALGDAEAHKHLPPLGSKFPTGALVSFSFDGAWKELRPHGAQLLSFARPKELTSKHG